MWWVEIVSDVGCRWASGIIPNTDGLMCGATVCAHAVFYQQPNRPAVKRVGRHGPECRRDGGNGAQPEGLGTVRGWQRMGGWAVKTRNGRSRPSVSCARRGRKTRRRPHAREGKKRVLVVVRSVGASTLDVAQRDGHTQNAREEPCEIHDSLLLVPRRGRARVVRNFPIFASRCTGKNQEVQGACRWRGKVRAELEGRGRPVQWMPGGGGAGCSGCRVQWMPGAVDAGCRGMAGCGEGDTGDGNASDLQPRRIIVPSPQSPAGPRPRNGAACPDTCGRPGLPRRCGRPRLPGAPAGWLRTRCPGSIPRPG